MEERRKRVVSFEDLEVFQRAYRVSLEIHRASLSFPAVEQRALAEQIRRASKSICANIAEGYAKQHVSLAEFKRFLVRRLVRARRCGCGSAIALISAISTRRRGSDGETSITHSPRCCRVSTGA
jgi:23S rRNA-intervening sequence protein